MNKPMHKLLSRQLKKAFGKSFELEEQSPEWQKFCSLISGAYEEFSNERRFIEHTLEMNSKELSEANRLITEKNDTLNANIEALSLSKSFLNRLIDSVPMYILTLDSDMKILSSNKKFKRSINKDYHDFFEILHESDADNSFKYESRALLDGYIEFIHNEMNLEDSYNNKLYIAWTHTMVEDEQGRNIILSIGSDLTHRKQAEQTMRWMAYNDSLTNIGNRRDFQKNLKRVLATEQQGAMVFIDVNHFKKINDLNGHNVGDQVLVNIAKTLKKVIRKCDCISRLAGDEFTVLLTNVNQDTIEQELEALSAALNSFILLEDGSRLHYTVSVGAALFPEHSSQDEDLIVKADMAMYQAKKMGMGRWHLFDPEKDDITNMHEDSRVIFCINKAIDESRMQLYYQPIFDLETKQITHYEALIRMFEVNGDIVFPGSFIPAAERMGLIRNIDEWVLEHALQNLALHLNSMPDLHIAVNISAPSLQAAEFPGILKRCLNESGVSAKHLIVEITETAYIENFDQVLTNLNQITALGVAIALDDFGVGFSSFSYLKKMPLTYVKLDGSYVKSLLESEEDQVFVESLSKMVEAFGMQTIAEFVGDKKTCERLRELGVKYAQGFYIAEPQPKLITTKELKNRLM